MCGTEINPLDLFCKVCGTKNEGEVTSKLEENVICNSIFETVADEQEEKEPKQEQAPFDSSDPKHEDFTWNIYEFPKPKKTEEVDFRWDMQAQKEDKQRKLKNTLHKEETSELLKEEIKQSAEEPEEEIVWELPKKEPLAQDIVVESFEDLPKICTEIETKAESQSNEMSDMDKFFTFSKKNEEFQELLDREYEKIQKKNMERPQCKDNQIIGLMGDRESKNEETGTIEKKSETLEEIFIEPTNIEACNDMECDTKPIDGKEVRKACEEVSYKKESEPENFFDSEMGSKLAAHADHLEEMAVARSSFFTEEPEESVSLEKPKGLPSSANETVVGSNTEVLVTVEVKANGVSETVTRQTIAMEPIMDLTKVIRATEETKEEKTETQQETKQETQQETKEETKEEKTQETTEEIIAESDKKLDLINTLSQADLTEFWNKNTFGMEEEKKMNKGKIALGVIAVILVIEITSLGIQYFFPKSGAAQSVSQIQTKIVAVFQGAVDGVTGIFETEEKSNSPKSEQEANSNGEIDSSIEKNASTEEQPVAPDPVPMSDKSALIASQIDLNKNIQIISKADALQWEETHNYGIDDLNKSNPIENNIWYITEAGEPIYYDQAIVGTLISFDSLWIDYINNGDKSVLDLLKSNSKAYNKVASFSKVGKISEVFKSLSIGEIRQGSVGFYVFTEEQIQVTENGKTRVDSYDWVYYLEPVDGEMKIVNYL